MIPCLAIGSFLLVGNILADPPPAHFHFATRNANGRVLEDREVAAIELDRNVPVKFIIHGWTENANLSHYVNMERVLLKQGFYNVIRVDYSEIAAQSYFSAATSVHVVGNYVGDFIVNLTKTFEIPLDRIHVIGHSLGAQVSGYVGRRVYDVTGKKIHRISGLDPARPFFENNFSFYKLHKDDASNVDIVHTDGGKLGYARSEGSVDFYPNGGRAYQPGCYDAQADFDTNRIMEMFYCSHHKSYHYYTAAILMEIEATRCSSWEDYTSGLCEGNEKIRFGLQTPDNAVGNFYFDIDLDDDFVQDVLLP